MKKLLILIPVLLMAGCSSGKEDMIFHYSVLKALDNGVLEGDLNAGDLKDHGDFGLGTYNKMNGEMVVLDHVVYRVAPDGKVMQSDDASLIPYSVVTFYRQDDTLLMSGDIDYPALKAFAERRIPSRNLFYAFRIYGEFDYIKCGGADIQERPYEESLNEILADRPLYEKSNIKGTLAGFWCPAYIGDINSAGFHLHFIADDLSMGGHLMEFRAKSLDIGYDIKYTYKMVLPETEDFRKAFFRSAPVNY